MLYPVLFDLEFAKFSYFVDYLGKNPNALQKDYIKELEKKLEQDDEEMFETLSENPMQPVNSRNIDDLWNLSNLVLDDCNKVLHPVFSGDIKEDIILRQDVKDFYQKRVKHYTNSISVIIDSLILYDNFPASMFRNYKILKELALRTGGEESALYLRRLVGIARGVIPSEVRMEYHEVIESGITSGSNPPDASSRG